jgi:hypothetical protein
MDFQDSFNLFLLLETVTLHPFYWQMDTRTVVLFVYDVNLNCI